VAIGYRSRAEEAEGVLRGVRAAGGEAVAIDADIAREGEVARMLDEAEARLGAMGPLANCARNNDAPKASRIVDPTTEEIRRMLDVNVVGTMLCVRGGPADVHRARGEGGCGRQSLLRRRDARQPERAGELFGVEGGGERLHRRAREGGRARASASTPSGRG
jgi:NAD(P)-dependent dehydrogenase (short-subunit alcohol dehydrogenase family)